MNNMVMRWHKNLWSHEIYNFCKGLPKIETSWLHKLIVIITENFFFIYTQYKSIGYMSMSIKTIPKPQAFCRADPPPPPPPVLKFPDPPPTPIISKIY